MIRFRLFLLGFALLAFNPEIGTAAPTAPVVVLQTSLGEIDIQLDPANAPLSTANFLAYVDKKSYDGTIFHRIIRGFVVQGGGFKPGLQPIDTLPPIRNEANNHIPNLRGSISMARTADPNSATSQFFLNLEDNSSLDANPGSAGYAVFGKIIKGLDVLDRMAQVPTTTRGPYEDTPITDVTLVTARRQ